MLEDEIIWKPKKDNKVSTFIHADYKKNFQIAIFLENEYKKFEQEYFAQTGKAYKGVTVKVIPIESPERISYLRISYQNNEYPVGNYSNVVILNQDYDVCKKQISITMEHFKAHQKQMIEKYEFRDTI